jgi:hypothetical protein
LCQVIGVGKNVEDIYPTVPIQEGMLFHTLYSPESEQYFEQMIDAKGAVRATLKKHLHCS